MLMHFDKIAENTLAADDLLAFVKILAQPVGGRLARIEIAGENVIDGKQNESHHRHDYYHKNCFKYGYRHGSEESLQPQAAIHCYYFYYFIIEP